MGTRAHDAVVRAASGLEGDLAKLARKHAKRLQAVSDRMVAELKRELKRAAKGSFKAARTAALLARFQSLSAVLAARFEKGARVALAALGEEAARIGRRTLGRQLAVLARSHPEALEDLPRVNEIVGLLDDGLVERYSKLSRRWSRDQMRTMRQVMADGAARGEVMGATWEKMAATLGIKDWEAARIVRTESSYAAHRRQLEDLKEIGGEWDKQLIAFFDNRTGEDSKFVHRQVRALDKDFEDNEGRVYPHPPNRPNDREVMVFIPR